MTVGVRVQLSPRSTLSAARPPLVSTVLYLLLMYAALLIAPAPILPTAGHGATLAELGRTPPDVAVPAAPGVGTTLYQVPAGWPAQLGNVRTPFWIHALALVPATLSMKPASCSSHPTRRTAAMGDSGMLTKPSASQPVPP